jgi:hypothetical protein
MTESPNIIKEKEKISVLIIEDDRKQVQIIYDAIDDYNNEEDSEYCITCSSASNYNDSLVTLLSENFDVAIIDLNLDSSSTDPSELDGNKLVDVIVNKLRFPIIIRTGFPQQFFSEKINKDNSFLKIYAKDDFVDDIIKEIVKWFKIGLTSTLGTKGTLEHYINKLFWEQISLNINEWENSEHEYKDQEKSLLRYTLNVLQSYLEIDIESGKYESFHPAEVYIKPPVNEDLFFGDILKNAQDESFIVLTPSCEMAQKKYKNILIARILKFDELTDFMSEKLSYIESPSSKKRGKLEKWFRNAHSNSLGYHFLPAYSDFLGGFIDFQDIKSVKPEDGEFTKVATVTNQFAKDISSRFTLYYARQGQPNLNSEIIFSSFSQEQLTR